VVDSGFLHDSSELLHAFLSWTRTGSAKEQIFGWIISTVILGGVSTLLLRMTRTLGRIVYVRHRQNSLYKDAFGEFFLYYPALVPDLNKNIPRVTRFIIHRGILSAALASQRDANNDRNVLYRGSGIKGESYLQFDMRSPEDRSAKLITVWNFQKRPGAAGRVPTTATRPDAAGPAARAGATGGRGAGRPRRTGATVGNDHPLSCSAAAAGGCTHPQ